MTYAISLPSEDLKKRNIQEVRNCEPKKTPQNKQNKNPTQRPQTYPHLSNPPPPLPVPAQLKLPTHQFREKNHKKKGTGRQTAKKTRTLASPRSCQRGNILAIDDSLHHLSSEGPAAELGGRYGSWEVGGSRKGISLPEDRLGPITAEIYPHARDV